ncbi:hypothetical protein H1C71_029448 [Ictidomys tridecemlineatus]|nr:hypothetical protein H1C71_029448 [Ictidomys tridecemlineatus]
MGRHARAQSSYAQRCASRQPTPANLRHGSPLPVVTTPPQRHRRKLLKNGGRFPSSPRRASAHTNLLPSGADSECSNRRTAGQRSLPIGSEQLPLCVWVPPRCPCCVVGLQRTRGQSEEVKGHVM